MRLFRCFFEEIFMFIGEDHGGEILKWKSLNISYVYHSQVKKMYCEARGLGYGYENARRPSEHCSQIPDVESSEREIFGLYPTSASPRHIGYGNEMVHHAFSQIAAADSHKSKIDGIEGILCGRKELLRSKMELILLQLDQRKRINTEIFSHIEGDDCYLQDMILTLGPGAYTITKYRLQLEKMKFDLSSQKRQEVANCFRDTMLLNTELKDTLLEYQREIQKDALFGESDLNEN